MSEKIFPALAGSTAVLSLYEVLQISPTASSEEIKKAYRSLAFKFHPDKNKDEDAVQRFHAVNNAADILLDASKRARYDLAVKCRMSLDDTMEFVMAASPPSPTLNDTNTTTTMKSPPPPYYAQHHPPHHHAPSPSPPPPSPFASSVPDSGHFVRFPFYADPTAAVAASSPQQHPLSPPSSYSLYNAWGGIGGEGSMGSGGGGGGGSGDSGVGETMGMRSVELVWDSAMGAMARPVVPAVNVEVAITLEQAYAGCSMPVEVVREVALPGARSFTEKEVLYVDIPMGVDDGEVVVLKHKGHCRGDQNWGDVRVKVAVLPHLRLRRHGLDLHLEKRISLKQSLCGFDIEFVHLNGKPVRIKNYQSVLAPGYEATFAGLGMRREDKVGSLLVKPIVEFPSSLTPEQRDALERIL